jgi:hypothetical protein
VSVKIFCPVPHPPEGVVEDAIGGQGLRCGDLEAVSSRGTNDCESNIAMVPPTMMTSPRILMQRRRGHSGAEARFKTC